MARKVFNYGGGKHSPAALSAFLSEAFEAEVAKGLKVVPTGSTGMEVLVEVGTGQIKTGQQYSRIIQVDGASETVSLNAASPSYIRHDLIVAYINNEQAGSTSVLDNTNDVLNLKSVAGTPSSSPADPSGAAIQSSVGAGNPYIILGRVRVPVSATSISEGNIDDLRQRVMIGNSNQLADGIIVPKHLAAGAVTASKTAFGGNYSTSEVNTGFKWTNGKDIYKKTINWTIASGAGTKTQAHAISDLEDIIDVEAVTINGGAQQPLSFYVNTGFYRYLSITPTEIRVEQGSAFSSNNPVRTTIYYTKT